MRLKAWPILINRVLHLGQHCRLISCNTHMYIKVLFNIAFKYCVCEGTNFKKRGVMWNPDFTLIFLEFVCIWSGWGILQCWNRHLFTNWEAVRLPVWYVVNLHYFITLYAPMATCLVYPLELNLCLYSSVSERWKFRPNWQPRFGNRKVISGSVQTLFIFQLSNYFKAIFLLN